MLAINTVNTTEGAAEDTDEEGDDEPNYAHGETHSEAKHIGCRKLMYRAA